MTTVGYARVSSVGQDLEVQLEKLSGCDKVFKEKRSGVDAGRPELERCIEYLREGDTLLVTKIDRLARSTSDLYRIVSTLAEKGVATFGGSVRWMASPRPRSGGRGLAQASTDT
jgi:DNA invertase Pin-like site-specific DNA recombinase